METYTLEWQYWDEVREVQFLVGDILELFTEVSRWKRSNAVTDDAILSIELD